MTFEAFRHRRSSLAEYPLAAGLAASSIATTVADAASEDDTASPAAACCCCSCSSLRLRFASSLTSCCSGSRSVCSMPQAVNTCTSALVESA